MKCAACDGRGWNVGECHPREVCGACDGDGGRFPVLHDRRGKDDKTPTDVPWALVVAHERQAYRNHEQTVQRLAERGGLCPSEMVAVFEDRQWGPLPTRVALLLIDAKVAAYRLAVLGHAAAPSSGKAQGGT